MKRRILLLLLALLCAQPPFLPCYASDTSLSLPSLDTSEGYIRALHLYADGDYRQAARLAEAEQSSRALALAARATLAHAEMMDDGASKLTVIRHAEALARTAIDKDRNNAEAYRLLAISLGKLARSKSPIESLLDGFPSQAKTLIDRALALEPNSPWAYAVLGGWHAEIVATAGPAIADTIMGASRERAKSAFETAIDLQQDNPVLHYEYAMALRRIGDENDEPLIRQHLSIAASLSGRDAFERATVKKAQNLLGRSPLQEQSNTNAH